MAKKMQSPLKCKYMSDHHQNMDFVVDMVDMFALALLVALAVGAKGTDGVECTLTEIGCCMIDI